jgi:hypothetical protein
MSRVLYFDCASGAAGDMILGALLDAGLPLDELRRALGSLGLDLDLRVTRVLRAGITATHFSVSASGDTHKATHTSDHHHEHGHQHPHEHGHQHPHTHEPPGHSHRSLKEIAHLIGHSALSAAGKARAVALFRRLAEAEAAIHGMSVDEVHLHEVGALDSIIDIVGAVFALEWWGTEDIVASPLNVGGGTVEIAHGTFPVPAPATVRLLTGVPVYSSGLSVELVTPTGALLISDYARAYGPVPAMRVQQVGYGAGTRDLGRVPNVVRVMIGERTAATVAAPSGGTVVKIECEIDDMSPQLFGPVSDRLFAAGALDVFLTAVQMKKGRPGTLLTALVEPERRDAICEVLFRETTTLGVRFNLVERDTLDRHWVEVPVGGGLVRIKVSSRRGDVLNAVPEFEDCLRIANETGRPVKAVHTEALRAWFRREEIE